MPKIVNCALKLVLIIVSLGPISCAKAVSETPLTDDTIIATWDVDSRVVTSTAQAAELLQQSRQLTASGLEEQNVARFIARQKARYADAGSRAPTDLTVLEARLLQRQHRFQEAQKLLENTVAKARPAGILLLSDIALQLGQYEAAQAYCKQLFGDISHITVITCLLNAEFAETPAPAYYDKLRQLNDISPPDAYQTRQWVDETLAYMALSLDKPLAAIDHLRKFDVQQMPVSTLLVWADAHLASGQANAMIRALKQQPHDLSLLDDGVLVRWVLAEQQLGLKNTEAQQALSDKIQMRTWRKDAAHAAQVARYYLDITPNSEQALIFAKLNWQLAKSREDRLLLQRAQAFRRSGARDES